MAETLSEGVWVAFGKMHLRFAASWTAKWAGLDMQAVHDDWERVLVGCTTEMIRFAIDNLPAQYPPNAQEFRAICMRAPAPPAPLQLAEPPADPAKVKAVIAEAYTKGRNAKAEAAGKADVPARLMWAHRLREEHRRGARLTPFQIAAYENAFAQRLGGQIIGGFTPPPADSLPPAMRAELYPEHGQQQDETP